MLNKKTMGCLFILAIYVDDILFTGIYDTGIHATKTYLQKLLSICDLESPRYFLGIEFVYQDLKLALTQQKYTLDMLHEKKLFGASQRYHLWKLACSSKIHCLHSLRMLMTIGYCWVS